MPVRYTAGAIVGIVLGSFFGLVLVVAVVVLIYKCRSTIREHFTIQQLPTRLTSENSDDSGNKVASPCPQSPVIVVVTDCSDSNGTASPYNSPSTFQLPSDTGSSSQEYISPDADRVSDVSDKNAAYYGARSKVFPNLSPLRLPPEDGFKKASIGMSETFSSAGVDNPSYFINDDEQPSTSSTAGGTGQLTSPHLLSPDATSLSGISLQDASVRRSYRLDSLSALAIAAELNRNCSLFFDNASEVDIDSDIVVVYRERTAL